jgi:ABC-type nitrate/sulfonate/bicarbonate transport system substrate-binding protein
MQKKWLVWGGLVVVAFIFIALRQPWQDHSHKKNQLIDSGKREKVRLAVANAVITAPVLIALEKDFFSQAGLEIEITGEFSSGKSSLEHMLAGKADISTPATTPIVFNSFQRRDYSIFLTYLTTYEGVKVIAHSDREIITPFDLKGKTIGMVRGTISEILLDTLLAYHKILPHEVVIKAYKGHELPEKFKLKEVDAISVWEPHAYSALTQSAETAIQLPTSQVYRIAINLAVMNDFAERHPLVLQKVIHAIDLAMNFMKEETENSQEILSRRLKLDKQLISIFWKDFQYGLSLDQLLLLTMENEARWAMKRQYIEPDKMPNYLDFILYKPLESYKPQAVTLVRKPK